MKQKRQFKFRRAKSGDEVRVIEDGASATTRGRDEDEVNVKRVYPILVEDLEKQGSGAASAGKEKASAGEAITELDVKSGTMSSASSPKAEGQADASKATLKAGKNNKERQGRCSVKLVVGAMMVGLALLVAGLLPQLLEEEEQLGSSAEEADVDLPVIRQDKWLQECESLETVPDLAEHTDVEEVKYGSCQHLYVRKGRKWYVWRSQTGDWLLVNEGKEQRDEFVAQVVDRQGNLWYFDFSNEHLSYLCVYKPYEAGGPVHKRIEILNDNARTFRDLTIYGGLLLANSNGYPSNHKVAPPSQDDDTENGVYALTGDVFNQDRAYFKQLITAQYDMIITDGDEHLIGFQGVEPQTGYSRQEPGGTFKVSILRLSESLTSGWKLVDGRVNAGHFEENIAINTNSNIKVHASRRHLFYLETDRFLQYWDIKANETAGNDLHQTVFEKPVSTTFLSESLGSEHESWLVRDEDSRLLEVVEPGQPIQSLKAGYEWEETARDRAAPVDAGWATILTLAGMVCCFVCLWKCKKGCRVGDGGGLRAAS